MYRRVHAIAVQSDLGDFAEEVRRVFDELGRAYGSESLASECSPGVDVFETDDSLEIVMDLPDVRPASVQIIAKSRALLVAGDKPRRRAPSESTFHLVERGYGRFARVVRLDHACDTARARATFAHGELHISIPKLAERRGTRIGIAIT